MPIKTLKKIFREFSRTLTDNKPIFVKCKYISVMKGPLSIATRIILVSGFIFKYLIYDFNATNFQKFFKNLLDNLRLLVTR